MAACALMGSAIPAAQAAAPASISRRETFMRSEALLRCSLEATIAKIAAVVEMEFARSGWG
jgi:hypothetical protein